MDAKGNPICLFITQTQDKMKKEIEAQIRGAINRHLVVHVRVPNDKRDRIDILVDESSSEILKLISHSKMPTDEHIKGFQLCPKCNGQGTVSKPPHIAGDVHEWTSDSCIFVCDVCNGEKILPLPTNGEKEAIAELELFYYEMGEDWHLWDEGEKGQYPIQRMFDAMKKFIEKKKNEG